jgi:NAD(P)-dependent dehydrogenase (short-subunit alcohol dehydrogenase family)
MTDETHSSLKELRALVTGGATRIGREISLGLARAGCDVVVHYAGNATGAASVVEEIRSLGRKAVAIQGDFANPSAPAEVARAALADGSIDILVNNASIYPDANSLSSAHSLEHETIEEWERSMAINARGPFFLMQALAKSLAASTNGNVINLLDRSISNLFVDRAVHSASKATLAQVTLIAAKTWKHSVRVNGIELGPILPGANMPEEAKSKIVWAGPGQVVDTILFILTTPFIRGEIIGLKNGSHLF